MPFGWPEPTDASASKQPANTEVLQVGCLQQLDAAVFKKPNDAFSLLVNFSFILQKVLRSRGQRTRFEDLKYKLRLKNEY